MTSCRLGLSTVKMSNLLKSCLCVILSVFLLTACNEQAAEGTDDIQGATQSTQPQSGGTEVLDEGELPEITVPQGSQTSSAPDQADVTEPTEITEPTQVTETTETTQGTKPSEPKPTKPAVVPSEIPETEPPVTTQPTEAPITPQPTEPPETTPPVTTEPTEPPRLDEDELPPIPVF